MQKKWLIIGVIILLTVGLLGWLFFISLRPQQPLPGEKVDDLGREHVTDISKVIYNSNPPTSGLHFPVWTKRGVYDRVLSDGYLIHSLEHGYVVLSYNCDQKIPASSFQFPVSNTYAHEGEPVEIHNIATDSASESAKPLTRMKTTVDSQMSFFTPQNPPEKEVELSEEFNSDSCKELISQLGSFLDRYKRIIVVPRPNLDNRIALTAWTRLEKMNSFDRERIKTFIDAYHNKAPEKTIE